VSEYVACNLCGTDDTRLLFRRGDYRYWIDDVEWNVVQCRSCGLGYVNPRPTRAEIGRYYPESYYAERDRLGDRYRLQTRYVTGEPGRLLEIGAARGDFLLAMRDRGWQVAGIEPFARTPAPEGLEISTRPFPDECDFERDTFDVVTAWAVFEHLYDPLSAFRACSDLLRPGGRLILQVPSLRSLSVRIAHQEDVPRHLYLFSPDTLEQYAETAGLAVTRIADVTDIATAGSRGSIQHVTARALGRSDRDLAQLQRLPRRERLRRAPAFATLTMGAKLLDLLLLPDWLLRTAGLSGQLVAEFSKPETTKFRADEEAHAKVAAL
jgi:SAM-dependent methyltransferase